MFLIGWSRAILTKACQTDGRTDRRTDRLTDKASYRVACPQLITQNVLNRKLDQWKAAKSGMKSDAIVLDFHGGIVIL